MIQSQPTNETIITDTLCVTPDVRFASQDGTVHLSRWRNMVGAYRLPALTAPIYVSHIGGKRTVQTWEQGGWSERASRPSDSTMVPERMESGWRVDGELDVVTVSIYGSAGQQGGRMRFAFADPLGDALVRQVLSQLYQPASSERDSYVEILLNTLRAHLLRGAGPADAATIPAAAHSADRVHRVLARINANPETDFSLEELAAEAGLNPTYFARVFRRATGAPPQAYITRKRMDKARHMLRQTGLSVAEISDSTGFKSQSHFSRLFRQQIGQTPSEFRGQKHED